MKNKMFRALPALIKFLVTLTAAAALFSSCAAASPLFGSWADNLGNEFTFFEDGKFNTKISGAGQIVNFDGEYTLLMNVLTLDGKNNNTNENFRIVTEWDIRGNILYLDWTSEDGSRSLSLYKTSN